jgi:hypothetical protein
MCVCVCVCVCVCATNYLRGWGVLTLSLVEQTGLLFVLCVLLQHDFFMRNSHFFFPSKTIIVGGEKT